MLGLGVPVLIGLILLLLSILRAAPRIVPFLAADVASVGPLAAGTRMLLTAFVALRVTILVPLVALVISLLGEISLLPLIVEISLSLVLPGLPGTLGVWVASLSLWLSFCGLSRLVYLGQCFFFFLGLEELGSGFFVPVDPKFGSEGSLYAL